MDAILDIPPLLLRLIAFAFGAVWGSFFTVAIYRWPREESVVRPPSTCPHCGVRIKPYHNIPIFGFLMLGGQTACCKKPLSPRYALVELISAVACVAVVELFIVRAAPSTPPLTRVIDAAVYFALVGGLIVATFVDLEWMQIPDEVSLGGAALALATAGLRSGPSAEQVAFGAGLGFLIIQVPFVWGYEALFDRRGMGEGDSKLLMMIGAFLGWRAVLFSLAAGAIQGLVATLIGLLVRRAEQPTPAHRASVESAEDDPPIGRLKVPFGPFLALSAVEFLFFGNALIDAYLKLIAPAEG